MKSIKHELDTRLMSDTGNRSVWHTTHHIPQNLVYEYWIDHKLVLNMIKQTIELEIIVP